jgi:Transposase zinc-binding domain
VCRTATLGGHLERCDSCSYERPAYDSCRNRHCPKCQSLERAAWVEKRSAELLPTHYFHVVFSVPEQIASIAYQNKKVVYNILFRATAETLFLTYLQEAFDAGKLKFFSSLEALRDRQAFQLHIDSVRRWNGSSTPSRPSPDPNKSWTMSAATPTGSPFPTSASWISRTACEIHVAGLSRSQPAKNHDPLGRRIHPAIPAARSAEHRAGFTASVTTVSWPIPIVSRSSSLCRQLLDAPAARADSSEPSKLEDYRDRYERLTGRSLRECPHCHRGHMIAVQVLPAVRSTPAIRDTS